MEGFFLVRGMWQSLWRVKTYLAHPPILSKPEKEEVLYDYIDVTSHAISLVLVQVEERTQKPVYYICKSLQKVKARYLHLEKPSWPSFIPQKSFHTTSKLIQSSSSPICHYKHCFRNLTTLEEWQSGEQCWEHSTSDIYLGRQWKDKSLLTW